MCIRDSLRADRDRWFHNLDHKVAAAILTVCHKERISGKYDPVERDLGARIKHAEDNSSCEGHMLGG
eukprot:11481880-Prorocentrum_lima.AAC.1